MKSPSEKFANEGKSVFFPAALGHSVLDSGTFVLGHSAVDYRTFDVTCAAWLPGCQKAPTPTRSPRLGKAMARGLRVFAREWGVRVPFLTNGCQEQHPDSSAALLQREKVHRVQGPWPVGIVSRFQEPQVPKGRDIFPRVHATFPTEGRQGCAQGAVRIRTER